MTGKSMSGIYCDDIRQELGGKLSLMGIYPADMLVMGFPLRLPKLCVHVTVKFPAAELPKTSFRAVLLKGDEVLTEFVIDQEALNSAKVPPPDVETAEEDRKFAIQFGFALAPFELEGPARLRLRGYSDGEEIKGNALRIHESPPGFFAPPAGAPQA